jgi:predicted CopG family antitoxin
MQQIDIDFEVFKALTAMRKSETHTYNEVVRDLLGLKKTLGRRISESFSPFSETFGPAGETGRAISGRFLPHGTLLRARYKSILHTAEICNGEWVNENGDVFRSASAAARVITGNNVNGLNFWEAKRPSDSDWRKLSALPKTSS